MMEEKWVQLKLLESLGTGALRRAQARESFCVSPWLGDQIHKATLRTLGDLEFNPGHWARASASPKTLPKGLADKLRATGGADRPLAQPGREERMNKQRYSMIK